MPRCHAGLAAFGTDGGVGHRYLLTMVTINLIRNQPAVNASTVSTNLILSLSCGTRDSLTPDMLFEEDQCRTFLQ